MPKVHKVTETSVNIYEFPKEVDKTSSDAITIGDLHGNAVKLLYFLLRHGIVEFEGDNQENDFEQFVKLYNELGEIIPHFDLQGVLKDNIKLLYNLVDNRTKLDFDIVYNEKTSDFDIKANETVDLDSSINELIKRAKDKESKDKESNDEEITETISRINTKKDNLINAPKKFKENTDKFNALVSRLKVKNKDILIRLIGDEFADRGNSDYYTLKLLSLLNEQNAKFTILLSNHGKEFLSHLGQKLDSNNNSDYHTHIIFKQTQSWKGLQHFLQTSEDARTVTQTFLDDIYLPNLKLIDYSLSPDSPLITLYTHAPTDLSRIKKAADYLGVSFSEKSRGHLAQTIDNINKAFREKLNNDITFKKKFFSENEIPALKELYENRNIDALQLTASKRNYKIEYAFGHVGEDIKVDLPTNAFNLDADSGKFIPNPIEPQKFRVLKTNEISLEKRLSEIKANPPPKPYFTAMGATFGTIAIAALSIFLLPAALPFWVTAATIVLGAILTTAVGALVDLYRNFKHFKNMDAKKELSIDLEPDPDPGNSFSGITSALTANAVSSQTLDEQALDERALFDAIGNNNVTEVQQLISQGRVNANTILNVNDETALMIAASQNRKEIVDCLLNYQDTEIDKQDSISQTALIHAALNNNKDIIKVLITKGANLDEKDQHGKSVRQYLSDIGYDEEVATPIEHAPSPSP